jgi:hypothetical protein
MTFFIGYTNNIVIKLSIYFNCWIYVYYQVQIHDIMLKGEGADFVDEKSVVLNRARVLPGEGPNIYK